VMFSCFIMLVSSHWVSPASVKGTREQLRAAAFGSSSEGAFLPPQQIGVELFHLSTDDSEWAILYRYRKASGSTPQMPGAFFCHPLTPTNYAPVRVCVQ